MAEKMANTIGRELRYFEYKFLKKQQSSKKGKKSKNTIPDGQLAWSDAPKSEDFRFTPKNEEFQKAMPGSKGEEELQMQVALAMSREEENERARRVESDNIRLEMAMKESAKEVNNAKPASQPSLLDISLKAPRPAAAAATPGFGTTNAFGAPATNDPWGGVSVVAAPAPTPTFDPFAPQQPPSTQNNLPTNGFGTTSAFGATDAFGASNDAWGLPQTSTAAAPTQNPWGGAQAFPQQPAAMPNTFPTSQPNIAPTVSAPSQDLWGGTQSFPTQPAPSSNSFPTSQAVSNPWGNNTPNMFDTPNTVPAQNGFNQQNGAWGDQGSFASSSAQQSSLDPFGFSGNTTVSTAPVMQSNGFGMPATNFNPPAFDPLKDFDSLHIGTNSEPAPVMLHTDMNNGQSVSRDIFPLTQVLAPQPVNATKTENEVVVAPPKKETEIFLGQNSNLVNLDSAEWKAYKTPYCTKPLGTASHNPFQQTAPSKSLNEMKSVQQPRFT